MLMEAGPRGKSASPRPRSVPFRRSGIPIMAHPLFGPEVRLMLQENDAAEMKAFCETLHPATVAEALTEEYSVEEAWKVLQHTTIRKQAEIFEYFPIEWQGKMVEGTGRPQMARLIEKMSYDDRVD